MTREDRDKIISNEYADFLVEYSGFMPVLEIYPNGTIYIINERYAVVRIPYEQIKNQVVRQFGYGVIPMCYGLESLASIETTGILRLRNLPNLNLRGQGVLIGVIDTGIDYTNPVFQNENKTTRIISIWDQTIDSEDGYPDETFYGTEYNSEQINLALQSANPYEIVPSVDENWSRYHDSRSCCWF